MVEIVQATQKIIRYKKLQSQYLSITISLIIQ